MFYDGIILSGATRPGWTAHESLSHLRKFDLIFNFFRNSGPVRLRTHLKEYGYNIRSVDFCDFYDVDTMCKILNNLVSTKTKFIGLSTVYLQQSFWNKYADVFLEVKSRFPKLKIIVGGQGASFSASNPYIDFCISGYAENALLSYLQYLDGSVNSLIMKEENTIDGNKDYPYNSIDLRNEWLPEDNIQSYEALPTEASRGCIFKCAFCNFPMKGKKKLDYIREDHNLETELLKNYEMFGVTNYVFGDDTFNDSTYKLEQIQKLVSKLPFKLRFSSHFKPDLLAVFPEQIDLLLDIGLHSANYGIESFNHKTRMAVKKMGDVNKILSKLKEIKDKSKGTVYTGINMIVGLPHESIESVQQSHEYIINSEFIDGSAWFPLQISDRTKTPERKLSPIDINPENYGYKVKSFNKNSIDNISIWKNEHMTFSKAIEFADKFALENFTKKHFHSFMIPSILNAGFELNTNNMKLTLMDIEDECESIKNNIHKTVDGYLSNIL